VIKDDEKEGTLGSTIHAVGVPGREKRETVSRKG
jgi:hypothetical protein